MPANDATANSTTNETETESTTADLPITTTWPNYCICPEDKVEGDDVTTITPDGNSTNTDTTTDTNNANMTDDSSATTNGTTTAKRRRRSLLEIEEFDRDVRLDLSSIGHRQVKILV